MCLELFTRELLPTKTYREIIVYKIFKLDTEGYFSPYRNFHYNDLRAVYESDSFELNKTRNDLRRVSFGFHSYANFQDAQWECQLFQQMYNGLIFVVMPCIIPQDTEIYKGLFREKECFCSQKLKFKL